MLAPSRLPRARVFAADAFASIAPSPPLRGGRAGRLDSILPLELAAARPADDVVLQDPAVLLVGPGPVERRFVGAKAEPAHDVGLSALLVRGGATRRRAVRRYRLDDQ